MVSGFSIGCSNWKVAPELTALKARKLLLISSLNFFMDSLCSPVLYQQTLVYNTTSSFSFIIPSPFFSVKPLHPQFLLSVAIPCSLPTHPLPGGAILPAQNTALHPSPSQGSDLCDNHWWHQWWKEGTVSQPGGSSPCSRLCWHLLVSQTAFACLFSSLLVLTQVENEGVNTLTWVITLRLLVFFLTSPSAVPKIKEWILKG